MMKKLNCMKRAMTAASLAFAVGVCTAEETKKGVDDSSDLLIPYETLRANWEPRPWSGQRFVFEPYGRNPTGRLAKEFEASKLLTPTWKFETYVHTVADTAHLHEYLWNYRPDGASKRQCYYLTRKYFQEQRQQKIAARAKAWGVPESDIPFVSMDGHGWYEPNVVEWGGVDLSGLEIGATCIASQAHLAFIRGSCRLHKLPMLIQMSQWFEPAVPFFLEGETEASVPRPEAAGDMHDASGGRIPPLRHCNAGHSSSLLSRMWYMGWLYGAAVIVPEASQSNFFAWKDPSASLTGYPEDVRIALSPIGEKAQKFMEVTTANPDRGIQYTPFALLLDHFAGFNGYHYTAPRPWNVLEPTPGDIEAHEVMDTIFPGSMMRDMVPGLEDTSPWFNTWSEQRYLVRSPYGDSFDVLLSPPPGIDTGASERYPLKPYLGTMYYNTDYYTRAFAMYPVVICVGDHEFTMETTKVLGQYLKQGGRLLMTKTHAERLGPKFDTLKRAGRLEIYDHKEVKSLMAKLSEEYLPVRVSGDLQVITNRTADGWVLGLINNEGVNKGPATPVKIDSSKTQIAVVKLKAGTIRTATEWYTGEKLQVTNGNAVTVEVPSGEVRIVEITEQ